MWQRIRREMLVEYYWWKRHSGKKRGLDSPLGIMGILIVASGIVIMIIIGQAFATMFRNMIPIVGGYQVASVYWYSIAFALKLILAILVLLGSVIIFIFLKLTRRR